MKIAEVTNNNVVSTYDEEGGGIIVMGRGIGFKAKKGSTIGEEKVEKIFRLRSQNTIDKFRGLSASLPMGYVQISAGVISYAKEVLNRSTNPNVYITLTDHINFALERYKQKVMPPNSLIREARGSYHAEYLIGEYAITVIEKGLGMEFLVDEAASIALHTVNAEYGASMGNTIKITSLIQQVSEMVREYFSIGLGEQPLNYERFITHPHFLAQRVLTGEYTNLGSLEFQEVIDRLYPGEYACSQRTQALIRLQYRHQVVEEEVAYLIQHIRRIRTK